MSPKGRRPDNKDKPQAPEKPQPLKWLRASAAAVLPPGVTAKLAAARPPAEQATGSPKGPEAKKASLADTPPAAAGTPGGGGSQGGASSPVVVRRSWVPPSGAVKASQPLEDFVNSGLLPSVDRADTQALLEVDQAETIASVVTQLHRRRQATCVVALDNGQKEFFDCMDLASHLLEAGISGGARSSTSPGASPGLRRDRASFGSNPAGGEPSPAAKEEWEATKKRLRKVATEPVKKALRTARRASAGGGGQGGGQGTGGDAAGTGAYRRVEAEESLEKMLPLLRSGRPVPVYRDGELCRTISPADVLELCLLASEETKLFLEQTPLGEIITKSPSMLSKLELFEDQSVIEVMGLMREAGVRVAPILSSPGFDNSPVPGARRDSEEDISNGAALALADPGPRLVGQFDLAALCILFARGPGDGGADPGQWWWEDSSLTSNILQETCVDFLGLGPRLAPAMSHTSAPYAAVFSEEPLARAITRAVSSIHQSVVVYQVDGRRLSGSSQGSRATTKPLEGVATTLGLLMALLEAGLFARLTFDASRPRRLNRDPVRRPTITAADVQEAISPSVGLESNRRTKVRFARAIELDLMCIPTCPEHGMQFMRFSKEGDSSVVDFNAIKDSIPESGHLGAGARCLACQRDLGQIAGGVAPPSAPPALASSAALSGGFLPLQALAGILPDRVTRGESSSSINPSRSALKAGTPGASPPDASPQVRATVAPSSGSSTSRQDARKVSSQGAAAAGPSTGGSFFSYCCASPCSGTKDQIMAGANSRGASTTNGASPSGSGEKRTSARRQSSGVKAASGSSPGKAAKA